MGLQTRERTLYKPVPHKQPPCRLGCAVSSHSARGSISCESQQHCEPVIAVGRIGDLPPRAILFAVAVSASWAPAPRGSARELLIAALLKVPNHCCSARYRTFSLLSRRGDVRRGGFSRFFSLLEDLVMNRCVGWSLLAVAAALATVVGVLVEVPVSLSVCSACNRTRHWFALAEVRMGLPSFPPRR